MTREGMERLIAAWVPRMGLGHWEITVKWDEPCDSENDAEFSREDWYDIATVRLSPDWAGWTAAYAERVVVHELRHLVTRDLDGSVAMAYEGLPETSRRLAERHYQRAIEGVVERMAATLVTVASLTPRSEGATG